MARVSVCVCFVLCSFFSGYFFAFLNLRVNRFLDYGRPRTADGFLTRELCSTVVKPISLRRAANATCCSPPVVARPSSLHNFASMFGNLRGHGVDDHVLICPLRPFAGMSFAAVAARRVFCLRLAAKKSAEAHLTGGDTGDVLVFRVAVALVALVAFC